MNGINKKLPIAALILLMLFLLLNSSSVIAAEKQAGKTLLTRGNVISKRNTGDVTLKRRSVVFEKDEIHVGADGRAQLRMIDHALISLQENTVLQIKNYQYQKGGKNNSALMELLSGGLRTITGAIGKGNKKAYELRTPLATIGIRGTDYEVEIVPNGMYVAVWEGVIHLRSRLKNGCNMLIGRSQPFMFIFIDRLGKCKGLLQVPEVFRAGHSSNISAVKASKRSNFVAGVSGVLGKQLVIEPLVQGVPGKPPVVPVVTTPPVTPPPVTPPVVTPPTVTPPVVTPPTVTPPVVIPPVTTTPPPVVTYDFNALNINQASPSSELDAKATALKVNSPTFKVGLNLFNLAAGGSITDYQESVGTFPVSWGYWNSVTSSSGKNIAGSSSNGLIWATYDPTDNGIVAARSGTFSRYGTITDSLVSGSAGLVSNLAIQMDVNFSDGVVTNGALSANTAHETWVAVFDGKILKGDLDLDLNGASVINSSPSATAGNLPRDASGFIAGDFVGDRAQAIVGGFGLSEDAKPSNHIEGVFLIKERGGR